MPTKPLPDWQQRNAQLLTTYCADRSIENRNAVVNANLPLVWRTARHESRRSGHSFDDLCQVGYMGLIRAVESYQPERGSSLSSIAIPWISGHIRHYLRDRCQPLRCSRGLRELVARAARLQQQRRDAQLPPLKQAELVRALGCSTSTWEEARSLRHAQKPASLEQPQQQTDGELLRLQDLLIDPTAGDVYEAARRAERRRLLWVALRELDRNQRRLLLGRVLQQQPWSTLGETMGCSGRVSRRQFQELLDELRQRLGTTLGADLLMP
jgi:RNA polymerase sigma factor (sigma-70 family)